ncbi:MAG: ribonuclease P protein component [Candidatus Omnitrophica bacterium]|nr:ribonuclease P protein component [Candidatus Omnitrophota bacterium]
MKQGRPARDGCLVAYALSSMQDQNGRLGISISKSAVSKAVQRNRIKRIVREVWQHYPREKAKKDLVLVVKKGTDDKNNKFIAQKTLSILNKILP